MDVRAALEHVAAALPGGEHREGQAQMAAAVARAVDLGRHLVVQAGTGTGKTVAYLVPALLSGKKTVIATATKALQDQLAEKDLPLVYGALGMEPRFAVLKGRSNYLCRSRLDEISRGDERLELDDGGSGVGRLGAQVRDLVAWASATQTGDRSGLDFEPDARAWAAVSVTAMECPGAARCPQGDSCFAELAREAADAADVVVVNTHLYGAHVASEGNLLPSHDVVVFDEAHELEDVAASSLGLELTPGRFHALARTAKPVIGDPALADAVGEAGDLLGRVLEPLVGERLARPHDDGLLAAFEVASGHVSRLTTSLREAAKGEAREPGRIARALQAAGHLGGDIAFVRDLAATHVAWVERDGARVVLRVAAVDVADLLAEGLWGNVTAVLTSATIPPGLLGRVGLDAERTDERDVGSPFDYATQAVLYCAAHLPDPRSPAYEAAMHRELRELLLAAGGRTLALFTSWRAMRAAAEALADDLPFRVMTQSELPKPALVRAFSTDETSCLFATMGFWQGVDVPGRACTQVVIDKLPFARPDDPLSVARRERAGPAAFELVDLPRAATLLAQGAGRLIRTSDDRGVVAVLDPRLATARYRWTLVNALPPMRRTRRLADVAEFLHTALSPSATPAADPATEGGAASPSRP